MNESGRRRSARVPLVAAAGLDAATAGVAGSEPEHRYEAERTIQSLATTLARLHSVPVPRELRADAQLVLAPAELVERAQHGTNEPGPAYRHLSRDRLVEVLRDGTPAAPDAGSLVLSHGRPTFAALRLDGPTPIGFADWADVALADPHLDLAVAARDLVARFGPAPIHAFFEHYGNAFEDPAPPDPVRLDWYLLADELAHGLTG